MTISNTGRPVNRNHDDYITPKVGDYSHTQQSHAQPQQGGQGAGVKTSVKVHNPPGRLNLIRR